MPEFQQLILVVNEELMTSNNRSRISSVEEHCYHPAECSRALSRDGILAWNGSS